MPSLWWMLREQDGDKKINKKNKVVLLHSWLFRLSAI
jgi:hypothetical protein